VILIRGISGEAAMVDSRPETTRVIVTDPDPTAAVKEALTLAIDNLSIQINGHFDANDKAVLLAREELEKQLAAMILTIDGKFAANKDLVDQLAKANAVALTAALSTQKESAAKSEVAVGDMLKQLQQAVIANDNVFAVLMDAVRVCSLGQITNALFEVGGQYRRNM
jgi:hypothetical protein